MPDILPFQQAIIENAIQQDALNIIAPGLGMYQIIAILLRVQDERRKLPGETGVTLVIGANVSQRVVLQKELDRIHPISNRYETSEEYAFPFEVTADLPTAERLRLYSTSSCLFVTTRILVVDFLSGRLDPKMVSGLIILNAHKATESSGEGFAVRLYKSKGGEGYVRAFSDNPFSFNAEFAKVEKVMKAVHAQSLQIWPRFRTAVQDDFDGRAPELVEISLPPDPGASIIYEAISELLDVSVKELRKYERLDTSDLTPSKGLTSSFDETIKRQLAPVWHTVSPKIRQLVSDMKTLRSLAGYLLKFDAITFLRYLENLKATEGVKSAWMFHSAAHVIFEGAKSRVYKLEETAGPYDNRIDKDGTEGHNVVANNKTEIKPTLDELPKWKCLIDILLELMDDVDANQNVIVFCQDEFTCEQLQTVIKPNGPSSFMESQYIEYLADKMNKSKVSGKKRTAAGASVANMVSFSQVEEAALLREARSLDVLKKVGSSSTESNIKGKAITKDDDNRVNDIQDPMEAWFANHVRFVSSDAVGALALWELLPHRIVVYDPDITVVRQIELFNAQNPSINLQVYLLRYEPSPEMDKFHALLARERNAFEELIKSKGAMAKQISKEIEPIYKPIERADNSVSANAITRKAGGRSLLDKPDKIRVIVDVREFMSPLPAVLHAQGYNVIPVTLEVGDYILSPEICVERKSIPDLRGSLASGRLFQQAEAMCKHYQIAILLIEFDGDKAFALQAPSEMGEDIQSGHIMSRLSLLCLHHPRLRLVWSRSLHATADIFRHLKSNYDEPDPVEASNIGLEAGETADSKEPAVNNTGLEILRRLPGVTDASVRPLAREAGSLAGLASLTLDKLIEIMGSAPYARRLYEFLHQSSSIKAGGSFVSNATMTESDTPTAFEAHFLGCKESKITSSSIVDRGSRIYLGLEGGVLEECSVKTVEGNDVCSTVACKPLFTQQHSIVKILPVLSGNCICVITSDACLRFVHPDSFECKVMHKGPIVSAAVSDSPVPVVAVARIGGISQSIRVGVYHILSKEGSISDWRILWEVKLGVSGFDQYASLAFLNAPFSVLYKHGTKIALAGSVPNQKNPIVETIYSCESKNRFDRVLGVPSMKCGVMLVDLLGIVLNDKGEPRGDSIRLDRLGEELIDSAVVGNKLLVLNRQGIHVFGFQAGTAEQFVEIGACGLNRETEDSGWTLTSEWAIDGTSAILTNNSSIWLISPQSRRKQVQQAIQSHDLETAYRLIQEVNGLGEWHLQYLMECGNKFLRDGNIHRGLECLEKCPVTLFQPYNIFLLFPEHMQAYIKEKKLAFLPECSSFVAFEEMYGKDGQRRDARSKDREHVLDYLFRMREFPGVLNKDGIDTLILHLLIDSDRQDRAIAFSTVSNDIIAELVIDRLKEKGWFHCLAQILSNKPGYSRDAVYYWKQAIDNLTLIKDEDESGNLDGLKRLLVSKDLTTAAEVLEALKWLVEWNSNAALGVIKTRPDVSTDAILEMCPKGDFRWQYLQLAIQDDANRQNEFIHTELVKSLATSVEKEIEMCINKGHRLDETQTPLQGSFADETHCDDSPSSFIAHILDQASTKWLHEDFIRLKELRRLLRWHIIQSPCIDLEAAKQYLSKASGLKEEVAIIACIQGEYKKMTTMLVGDLDGGSVAIQFAKRYLNHKDHLELLDLLLEQVQTQGRGNWEVVGHFMASLGDSVDIENTINSISGDTSLAGMDMLLQIIFHHIIHSKRQGEVVKSLHLSRLHSLMEKLQQLKAKKIIIDDTVCCSICHLRIGQKVFVVKEHGSEATTQPSMICLKCYKDSSL